MPYWAWNLCCFYKTKSWHYHIKQVVWTKCILTGKNKHRKIRYNRKKMTSLVMKCIQFSSSPLFICFTNFFVCHWTKYTFLAQRNASLFFFFAVWIGHCNKLGLFGIGLFIFHEYHFHYFKTYFISVETEIWKNTNFASIWDVRKEFQMPTLVNS